MAKKFAGFTVQQAARLLGLPADTPRDMVMAVARSRPDVMVDAEQRAKRMITRQRFNEGGYANQPAPSGFQAMPEEEITYPQILQRQLTQSRALTDQVLQDPTSMVTTANVVGTQATPDQMLQPGTGQLTGPAPQARVATAGTAPPAQMPTGYATPGTAPQSYYTPRMQIAQPLAPATPMSEEMRLRTLPDVSGYLRGQTPEYTANYEAAKQALIDEGYRNPGHSEATRDLHMRIERKMQEMGLPTERTEQVFAPRPRQETEQQRMFREVQERLNQFYADNGVGPAPSGRGQSQPSATGEQAPQVAAATATPGIQQATAGQQAAQGTVTQEMQAAQGDISQQAIADTQATVDPARVQQAEAGTRTVQQQEQVNPAAMADIPSAQAAQSSQEPTAAQAATFQQDMPQAQAQDVYNLTPTQAASMTATTVQDAAKAVEYPDAQAAQSDFQSMVSAAQGSVGAEELINAKDITATAQAVTAVAATMDAVNNDAIAKAATGSFSQTMLANAAQGSVPADATVAGQMSKLMEQFNDGTPAWAAGAMRAANAAMAARGLGGSSMAGAAIVQASMEAARPIAQADAQVFAQMNMQNVNNRQQVALANAAAQQGIELQSLNNNQQAAMANAAQSFELQRMNLSNQQAVVLANAQLKAGLQEQTLGIDTQISLTNAARFAEKNNINLSNAQQAMLQRSAENLQVEMSNLSNEQQSALSALQVKASLLGQELTNEQQVAMLTSTQAFEAAQFDASAKQQAFMQDATAQAALEGRALDARQQTQLFNIANALEERQIELTNEQQARIFNTTNRVQFEAQDLSNRQQTALANVQIEATLRGQELSNKQQAAVVNAERFAEANNLTFTTESQMQLANSQMMQSVGLAELNARQAAALQNATTLANMDMANLNNRQQANVQNAQSFLQMDMANLSNEQQEVMFESQAVTQALLSDQAAENAARQFNASSQMQVDQFFASMANNLTMFNTEQYNAMQQFNAGQTNALEQFNAEMRNQRDMFNGQNALVIEQANTQWMQQIATAETAVTNQRNLQAAADAQDMTVRAFGELMSESRDLFNQIWTTANNDAERATDLARQQMQVDMNAAQLAQQRSDGLFSAMGALASNLMFGKNIFS